VLGAVVPVLVVVAHGALGVAGASAATSTVTLAANADAFVSRQDPAKLYGNWMSLNFDGSPERQAYLRFVVPSSVGTVSSASLRIYVLDGTPDAGTLFRVPSTSWNEYTVSWNSKPALGTPIGAVGSMGANTWKQIDVSSYVTGPGTYTVALAPTSDDGVWAVSREGDPSQAPQLVLSSTPPASDTQAPTTPGNLKGTVASPLSVNVTWSASSDNVGVTGYRVKRDGVAQGVVTGTSFVDSTVQSAKTYLYTVSALDAAGNASPPAGPVSVTTPSGPPPPPPPPTLDGFERSVSGSWGSGQLGAWSYEPTAGSAFSLGVNGHVATAYTSSNSKGNLVVGPSFTGPATASATFTADFEPGSGTLNHWQVIVRHQAARTYYAAQLYPEAGNQASLVIFSAKNGVFTDLADVTVPFTTAIGSSYVIKFAVSDAGDGVHLSAKAWPAGGAEPSGWEATAVDGNGDKLMSGNTGVRLSMYSGPVTATVDDFRLVKP
jgi:hypothetical protein